MRILAIDSNSSPENNRNGDNRRDRSAWSWTQSPLLSHPYTWCYISKALPADFTANISSE